MAREVTQTQSTTEGKPYRILFNLPSGVALTDVGITHTPPSGDPATIQKIIDAPEAWVYAPKGLALGRHQISVVAVTDDAHVSPEVRLFLDVVI